MASVARVGKHDCATVAWDGKVHTGRPISMSVECSAEGFTTVDMTFYVDDVSEKSAPPKKSKDDISWDKIRKYVDEGRTIRLARKTGGYYDIKYSATGEEERVADYNTTVTTNTTGNNISYEESDEMTKNVEFVYIPYAVNQRTKETWEGERVTGLDYASTLQRAILENAQYINALGDSDEIYVWLGEVGEFEPIE